MHTLTEIKVLAKEFEKAVEGYRTSVLTNKDYSLDDRWNAYVEIEKFLPIQRYGDAFIDKLGWDSVYDDLNIERHETREFSFIWEVIEYNLQDADNYDEDDEYFTKYRKLTQDQLDVWREAVLESGYGSFTFDW